MSGLSRGLIRLSKDYSNIILRNNSGIFNGYQNKINSCSTPSLTFKRCYQYHGEGKTTVTILNIEDGAPLMINSYSQVGFRFNNGHAAIGPVAVFPKTVLSWNVSTFRDINMDSLSLFFTLEPKLDLLIIGLGEKTSVVDASFVRAIRNKGINVEILTTEHACSTFNFLNMEKRTVAAALIPPRVVTFLDQDRMDTQFKRKNLYKDEFEDVEDDLISKPPLMPPRSSSNPWQEYHDLKAKRDKAKLEKMQKKDDE